VPLLSDLEWRLTKI